MMIMNEELTLKVIKTIRENQCVVIGHTNRNGSRIEPRTSSTVSLLVGRSILIAVQVPGLSLKVKRAAAFLL